MRMRRRYHARRAAVRPTVPAYHEEHVSVLGPPDAIQELNKLIEAAAGEIDIPGLKARPLDSAPPVHVYNNRRWHAVAAESQAQLALALQVYSFDERVVAEEATEKLRTFVEKQDPELRKKLTVCVDPAVDSPFEGSDSPFEGSDSPFEGSDSPFEGSDSPFEGSDSPFEGSDSPFEGSDSPFEGSDSPLAIDATNVCNTVAGQPAMERTGFNWLRQGRPDLTGAGVTVVILDTLPVQGKIDVAHDHVDFWLDWVGDRVSPAEPAETPPARPFIPAAAIHKYHGVMVASLVRHVAPEATIVAARVLDDRGKGWSTTVIQAMLWALSHRKNQTTIEGRRLIHDKLIFNLSMGLPRTQAEATEAVCLLRTLDVASRAGTLTVAAAGNDSLHKPENPVEPAAFGFFADTPATAQQVIAVAGTDRIAAYAFFSNEAHLAAPSRHIIGDTGAGSYIRRNYGFSTVRWSGTSFATPQITGLAALLWSSGRVPHRQLKRHIWRTSRLPGQWNGVREIDFVRAFRAL
jgi:hypothetical protein